MDLEFHAVRHLANRETLCGLGRADAPAAVKLGADRPTPELISCEKCTAELASDESPIEVSGSGNNQFAGTGWSEGERQYLIRQMLAGRAVPAIVENMGRSEPVIRGKILEMRRRGILAPTQSPRGSR